jgi:6-phosphogluconolactonase
MPSMTDDVRVFGTPAELGDAAAAAIARALQTAVDARGTASIVLSGGRTPLALYDALVRDWLDRVPWGRLDFYWGDERYVPHDHADSNFGSCRQALLVHTPVRPGRVQPMATSFPDAERAAAAYDATLQRRSTSPLFDVVLLGIGDDGHTASIFPGAAAVTERSRRVVATMSPIEPRRRVTMTFAALFDAAAIHVLAAGTTKAEAIRRIWSGASADECPAAAIRSATAPVTWWVDRAASATIRR